MVLAWGSFVHHILDGMWLFPKTYLWPVYGWSFPKGTPEDWFWLWIQELLMYSYMKILTGLRPGFLVFGGCYP